MLKLIVPEMTCGHCASAITRAVAGVDSKATVDVDLERHLVSVASGESADAIRAAVEDAGYAVDDLIQESRSD
ncbi:heavy-metal-associated domain-containing protein [Gilvimarinus sp. F26214L]|uniref:heavy-metal-associated domain-containing protein n=1 Tax=Gilvimarinus sp. DZF01 TaxID=3461371 RepID=UPI0040459F06